MTAQFSIREADPQIVARLAHDLGLPRFIATTLVARGITTVRAAKRFLNPSLDRDWRNPLEIPGLAEVADGLIDAIREKKRIVVFGDFDLDGISATTVLTRGLRALGACAFPFVPRRFEEGYGITAAAFERARALEPDVIVTVDCGIACKNEVADILKAGVEVYITDHHEAADLVPEGVPVADPKMSEDCPSAILAGVGVALKLVQVLGSRLGFPHLWRSYTDFATLGTVADLMPMRDENRALVADGLARMNTNPRPCIAALLATTGQAGKPLSATNLSFSLIPRLNAAGRMGNADLALDLLMCDNYGECCAMAEALEDVNNQRRAIEAELSDIAKEQAGRIYHGQRALVVAGEGWHEGVKGIVASRLVNTYGVPALLFTIDGDEARGSGRSVGNVNLFEAVESISYLTKRFGGHGAAVGVTIPTKNLKAFAQRLDAYMQKLPEAAFHPLTEVDALVSLDELTLESVALVERLAPFGQENPQPTFLARNVTLVNTRAVGQTKDHFACTLTNGRASVAGIMFHCAAIDALLVNDAVVDAAFTVQIDEWRGRRSVKAMLETVAPARSCCALEACLDPDAVSFTADLFAEAEGEPDLAAADEAPEPALPDLAPRRAQWEETARRDPDGLEAAIVKAIIDDRPLHPAQREILDRLRAGKSTFAVMATGRGKSLCFQTYAAFRALTDHAASLFIYPLRALIADQVFHLRASLERFGIASAVITGESTPEERAAVEDFLAGDSRVVNYIPCAASSATVVTPSYSTTAYVEVMASDEIGKVVDLFDYKSGDPITMGDEGVYIDQKLSELLKVSVGDTFFLDGDVRGDVTVAGIYEHYTGHFIYMTPGYYENALHADGEPNAYLLNFTSDDTDTCNAIFEKLLDMSGVATTSRMRDTQDTYMHSMERVDFVVVIIILAAAALAMVVLFNLSNINITERQRELATIKLLGFYDGEVSAYVYRENIVLTLFGILLGCFMGHWLHIYLVRSTEIDLMMFGRQTAPSAYVYAAILTALFSLLVNVLAHFRMKKIDMVESLKSAE